MTFLDWQFMQAELCWKGTELDNLDNFSILICEITDNTNLEEELVYIVCFKNGTISFLFINKSTQIADAHCPFLPPTG